MLPAADGYRMCTDALQKTSDGGGTKERGDLGAWDVSAIGLGLNEKAKSI
jgi:hypothetical protein